MDIKQLETRIEKKKADIQKIEKRIDKWQSKKSEAAFIKDEAVWYANEPKNIKTLDQLIQARNETRDETLETSKHYIEKSYEEYLKNCDSEIRHAQRDLAENTNTLKKYEAELEKVSARNAVEKLPVFVEFLNNWKQDMTEYITENVKVKKAYYEANSEAVKLRNDGWKVRQGMIDRDEYMKALKEAETKERSLRAAIHPITNIVYSHRTEDNINHEELEKILDKEVDNKYWNMIIKTQEITGEITDASDLRLGDDGNINGIIIGKKGKARLETIYAGGYNQDIIVNTRHGQRLHFRLIVHAIK